MNTEMICSKCMNDSDILVPDVFDSLVCPSCYNTTNTPIFSPIILKRMKYSGEFIENWKGDFYTLEYYKAFEDYLDSKP